MNATKFSFQIEAEINQLIEEAKGHPIESVDCTIFDGEQMVAGFQLHPCGHTELHLYQGFEQFKAELEEVLENILDKEVEFEHIVEEMDEYNESLVHIQ